MANYGEIRKHALELQKIMMANPANAGRLVEDITTEAIYAAEDIHKVLDGHEQLAEMLQDAANAVDRQSGKPRGVISWLFGPDQDMPDHLG